jgi:hypothetical protein
MEIASVHVIGGDFCLEYSFAWPQAVSLKDPFPLENPNAWYCPSRKRRSSKRVAVLQLKKRF